MNKKLAAALVLMIVVAVGLVVGTRVQGGFDELASPELSTREAQDSIAPPAAAPAPAADRVAGGSGGGTGGPGVGGLFAGATAGQRQEAAAQDGSGLPPLPEGPITSNRVIKNISLEVEIEDDQFQRQFSRAGSVAEQFGGFVISSQVGETDGRLASGSLTIRVPSNRFEEAVNSLKGLGRVTAEQRSGRDVSKEFVDLEARLRQARAEEAFFLRLMDEADGISDMIQIQSQLSAVQLRIEEIQGQLNFLRDQTELSTITVRLFEPGASFGGPPRGLAKAWEGAVDGFQLVVGGIVVALGWLAPIALIALAGLMVLRLRNRGKATVTPEAPPASS